MLAKSIDEFVPEQELKVLSRLPRGPPEQCVPLEATVLRATQYSIPDCPLPAWCLEVEGGPVQRILYFGHGGFLAGDRLRATILRADYRFTPEYEGPQNRERRKALLPEPAPAAWMPRSRFNYAEVAQQIEVTRYSGSRTYQ